ncbi:MAG: helix-turn-helix domain-containing protein, partial [Acetatifactor sp.]|nr:helix-turn-helix domain-containing protein [Acetatifactor sp.]
MEKMLIGAYIKQKREDKGWSQDALCEGICSRSNLSRIENDDQTPSFTLLEKLVEKLGQPSRQFLMLMDRDSIAGENLKKRIRNDSVLYQDPDGEERALIRERILKDLK